MFIDNPITLDRPNFAYGDFEPCPFCGNYQIYIFVNTDTDKFYTKCERGDSCGAKTHECTTIDNALNAWNKRVPTE